MEAPVTDSTKMVHNGLIGGTPKIDEQYDEFNSLYYSECPTSEVALIREIPSEDLISLREINTPQDVLNFRDINPGYEEALPISEFLNNARYPLNPADTFPNLEEHDLAGRGFKIELMSTNGGKGLWYYSTKLSKVFIRMDQTIYIQVEYLRLLDNEAVLLRIMMVFRDDIGMPVKRCNNHKHSKDLGNHSEAFIESVVRCENSSAQYLGTAAGKNVNDRLSVLIPLSAVQPDEKNVVKQSIALKFVCQNSCIGRRPTALIFTLENKNGEVLGKRFISVKICSCPKRDKEKEEAKRKSTEEGNLPPGKKLKVAEIKEEPEDIKPDTPNSEIEHNTDEVRMELLVPDKEFMLSVMDHCFAQITKRMALEPNNATYSKYFKEYKSRLLKEASENGA